MVAATPATPGRRNVDGGDGGDGCGVDAMPRSEETIRRNRPMDTWKREKAGEGRYHIRGADGIRRPGVVMGGGKTWAAELSGKTIGYYPTASAACAALYEAAEPVYRGEKNNPLTRKSR